jgi:branched-chain amino acid transport system permease protein
MNIATIGVGIETGIALGGVYAMVGLAFNLIYSATRLFVFSLEAVVALGGILSYITMADWHAAWPTAVALSCAVGAAAGAVLDLVGRRPLVGRTRNLQTSVLLVSIGISIAADAAMGVTFGASPRQVPGYVTSQPFHLGAVPVQWSYVIIMAVTVIIAAAVELALHTTRIGHRLRVLQEDTETAQLFGIRIGAVSTGVFVLAGLLAALSGFLITPLYGASSTAGNQLILPVFVALALGGFGSFRGAIVGGVLTGLAEGIAPLYFDSGVVTVLLFAVVVTVLLVRPIGVFGRPEILREV